MLRETTNEEPLNADSGALGQCFDVSMGFLTVFLWAYEVLWVL